MDLRDWIHLTQVRNQWPAVVKTVMNLRVPLKAEDLTSSMTVSVSRSILHHGVSYVDHKHA
jgi:hypothetical protein